MNAQNFENQWDDVKEQILGRWKEVEEGEVIQADGISELATLISRKSGEPQPNVQHELVHLIQTHDEDHPLLKDHYAGTSAARGSDIYPQDDQSSSAPT